MIALTHENKLAKPAWDARAVDLGRGLDARRNAGWMWLSTQEQVAIARLGKALAANQKALVAGELVIGGNTEAIGERKLFGRNFSASELASGVRFTRRASRRCSPASMWPAFRAAHRRRTTACSASSAATTAPMASRGRRGR